jgi:hypothetical protein
MAALGRSRPSGQAVENPRQGASALRLEADIGLESVYTTACEPFAVDSNSIATAPETWTDPFLAGTLRKAYFNAQSTNQLQESRPVL